MRILIILLAACSAWGQTAFVSGAVGDYSQWPSSSSIFTSGGLQGLCTLNGSTLKCSQCGFVATAGQATKTLQNVHALIGGVTKTGGTDLRMGIQATSTASGPPVQPDGTWAAGGTAYATVADGSITANTWLRSGTVGGSLSMSNGDLACLVIEPENYAGSDSYLIRSIATRTQSMGGIGASYNGSAWASGTQMLHLLEFTDGTYGYIGTGSPMNTVATSVTFNSSSSPDEIALKIQPSVTMGVIGICSDSPYSTATGDMQYVLYNGTTQMTAVSLDAQQIPITTTNTTCGYFTSTQTLTAGGTYYASIKPTTTNNVRVLYNTVSNSGYWSVYGGGTATNYSSRTDAGSWSDTDVRRPMIWLLINGAGSTSGGSGGAYVVAQ